MSPRILRNAIITPDGTELVSRHRHDFVSYKDDNGCTYYVDGGNEYLRRGWSGDADYEEASLDEEDAHGHIREKVEWGKLVNGGHQWIKIKNLNTDHIQAIIEGNHAKNQFKDVLVNELAWRQSDDNA